MLLVRGVLMVVTAVDMTFANDPDDTYQHHLHQQQNLNYRMVAQATEPVQYDEQWREKDKILELSSLAKLKKLLRDRSGERSGDDEEVNDSDNGTLRSSSTIVRLLRRFISLAQKAGGEAGRREEMEEAERLEPNFAVAKRNKPALEKILKAIKKRGG